MKRDPYGRKRNHCLEMSSRLLNENEVKFHSNSFMNENEQLRDPLYAIHKLV
jgi:hypothetical protein